MASTHPSFGTLADDRIIIFDTTLRDGEQSPGFSMNLEEKLRMAEALWELGIDVMEAGFPIASPGDFESVLSIAKHFAKDGPVVCGLSRTAPADILRAAEAVKPAARKRIHTFVSTSALHMRVKLRLEPEQVLDLVTSSVSLARQHTDDVEWSAEDGTRTEIDFLCRCVETADPGGRDNDQHLLSLTVKPRIAPGGGIFMDLDITKDEPLGEIQGNVNISKNTIKTSVLVNDSETIVIGGIYKKSEQVGESGIPGLSKIPILGRLLFKEENKVVDDREVLVFITPMIVNIDRLH